MEKLYFCEKLLPESVISLYYTNHIYCIVSATFWFILYKTYISVSTEKKISTLLEEENEITVKCILHKEQRLVFIFIYFFSFFHLETFMEWKKIHWQLQLAEEILSRTNSGFSQATEWSRESSCEQKECRHDTTIDFFKVLNYTKLNTFYIWKRQIVIAAINKTTVHYSILCLVFFLLSLHC